MSERITVYLTDRKARQLVELALVHMASPDTFFSGPYRSGQFGWILEGPIRFKSPIPAPGRLNLFKPDATLEASLEEAESFASGHSSSQT